jgi:alkylhydroperoxidase/carboxymuconolactone decarboxylase family protein YurZ
MTAKPRRAAEPVTGLLNQTALDDATLNQLREWDPRWAEACQKMSTSPLIDGVLPRKVAELIGMAVSMGCSQNHPEETQRHIRAAVEAGAARDEIPMVLKMATLTSIRSISIGTKILVKEASMEELDVAAIGRAAKIKKAGDAPASVNKIKAAGLWNEDWEQVYFLAPVWLEEFMMATISVYESGVLSGKDIELLNVAFEVSR